MPRRLILLAALIGLTASLVGAAHAQMALTRSYISEDGHFSFQYPENVSLRVMDVALTFDVGDFYLDPAEPVRVRVSAPTRLNAFVAVGAGSTPHEIAQARLALWMNVAPSVTSGLIAVPDGAFNVPPPVVGAYTINGRSAAYAEQVVAIDPAHSAAVIVLVIDVGADHVVTITASPSLDHGADFLRTDRAAILAMAGTFSYTPEINASTENALPLASDYAGEIGHFQTGDLRFQYPKDWYILAVSGNLFLTNQNVLLNGDLRSGMLQTNIIPPDFNRSAFAGQSAVAACTESADQRAEITPSAVLERQLLSPERLASYEEQDAHHDPIETVTLGGKDAAYIRIYTPERDVLTLAVDLGGGNVVSMMAFAYTGEMALYDDTLFALAGTLSYTPSGCVAD